MERMSSGRRADVERKKKEVGKDGHSGARNVDASNLGDDINSPLSLLI